jgi:hypothetical protein
MDFKAAIQHTFSELTVVGGLAIIIPFGWILYALFFHPLARIPGPLLASISPIWKLQRAIKGTLHRDILNGHQKYGRIFRVAPNEVSIADPEAIKVIYALNAGFNKVRDLFGNPLTIRAHSTPYGATMAWQVCSRIRMKLPTRQREGWLQMRTP